MRDRLKTKIIIKCDIPDYDRQNQVIIRKKKHLKLHIEKKWAEVFVIIITVFFINNNSNNMP